VVAGYHLWQPLTFLLFFGAQNAQNYDFPFGTLPDLST